MPLLFSYGSLQRRDVQLTTFGRPLDGTPDALPGFAPSTVPSEEAASAAVPGLTRHANLVFNGRADSRATGSVFDVTEEDLAAADRFEARAAYERIRVRLASGQDAWVYVHSVSARDYARRRPDAVFSTRLAMLEDMPALHELMVLSIRRLIGAYLDDERVDASFEIMGVDTTLIEDGTYFVVEQYGRIAGCGGWSRRATLFGGDHSAGRDARRLDPQSEAARIRAMYTHPDFARRGVGRLVLGVCEEAARREGFRALELVATVAGEPLYAACGFSVVERIDVPTSKGVIVPCARMAKRLGAREVAQGHQQQEGHR